MNKKKIIGIVSAIVALFAVVGVGLWFFLGRTSVETEGGNRLNVEWYDVNGKEFTITTADELYELAQLSNYYDFKGQTIKLGADIVVNEGNAADWAKDAPKHKWSPISGFGGVFDGQGHTISGLYATGYDAPIALFSNTMTNAEIKDFRLTNTYFESTGFGGVASISSNGGGKYKQIYSDAILNVVGTYSGYAGGICSKLNLQATIEECWYDGVINTTGRDAAGIVDNVLGCRVTISHCLFSGEINSTWDFSGTRTAGLVGRVYKSGAGLVLNDSLSVGKIDVANVYYSASILGASMGSTSLTTTNTYGSTDSYDVAIGRSGSNGTINSAPLEIRGKDLIGTKAYEWTNLDFDNYWTLVEDGTPILQHFADKTLSTAGLEKAFDTSWYTEGSSEFVIEDLKDLYGLYYLGAGNTFSGKTIKLGADIAINEGKAADWAKDAPANVWYPVSKFSGTFDGQGHTISGMYINTSSDYVGLFKQTTLDATVKNLNVKNGYIHNDSTTNVFMGTISGRGGGTFDTIYADTIMVSYGSIVGGIFGQVNAEAKNTFTNCWFDGSIEMKGEVARYVGGIAAGAVKGNTTFQHCLNTATISQLDFKDAGMFVGGIVGYVINDNVVASITDCLNAGKISVNYHVCVGSVAGRLNKATVTLTDTYATTESYTYSDGTFRGIGTSSNNYTGGVANLPEALISGKGGYQWTTLNFKDYWTIVTGPDGTPILKSFANKVPSVAGIAKKIDISWYNADKKEFVLKDLADLYGFYIVSGMDAFKDKTVKLGADIAVNAGNVADWAKSAPANQWFPINKFAGTFDGQGHTISGVYLKTDATYAGLFSQTTNTSTIKNLKLTNSYMESTLSDSWAGMGSIAGQMGGTLDTVYSDAIVVGAGTQIGGLVGRVNRAALEKYAITNCWFDGSVTVKDDVAQMAYIGGIAGVLVQGYLDMSNCLNTGTVTYLYDKLPMKNDAVWNIGTHVGGLVGGIMNGTQYNDDGSLKRVSELNLTDSMNTGVITAGLSDGSKAAQGAGSIFGYTTKGTVNMSNVYSMAGVAKRTTQYNTKSASVTGNITVLAEASLLGVKGYQNTLLNFNKYWSARTSKVPALTSFVGKGLSLAGAWRPDTSWYDESKTTYTISTIQQLYGLASLANAGNDFAGKTVKLGATIDVNSGWTAGSGEPANVWNPIDKFAGTFDGNGKTISGIYVKTSTANAGLFAVTTNTSTVKNLKLTNSYFYSDADNARLGSVVGNLGGTLDTVYSSAIVEGTMDQIGGLVGASNDLTNKSNGVVTITNCWFDGTVSVTNEEAQLAYVGGVVGVAIQGTLNMDNCLNTGEVSYTYGKMPEGTKRTGVATGGLVGGVMNGIRKDTGKGTKSEFYVSDSLNVGSVHAQTSAGVEHPYNDGVRSVVGYTTAGTVTIKENVYATSESASGTIHYNKDRATITGSASTLAEATLLGTKGYTYTLLDFDKYWSARSAQVPALKSFVGAGISLADAWRPDTDWEGSGTKADPYIISTIGELYGFAQEVNGGNDFAGEYIELGASIDVNEGWTAGATAPENIWTPIGSTLANAFQGTFDGKGYEIKGIYVDTNATGAGLFGHTRNSVIKNFSLKNSYINSTAPSNGAYVGSIIGYGEGKLENIYSNAIIVSTGSQAGGFVGRVQEGNKAAEGPDTLCEITNCWFDGSITVTNKDSKYAGGFAGFVIYGKIVLDNCLFTGDITATFNGAANVTQHNYAVGGFVGQDNAASTVEIKNSLGAGTITANSNTGTTVKVLRCGSIMGYVRKGLTLENVYVTSECYGTTVESAHASAVQTGSASEMKTEKLLGVKGYQMTMLDFDTYWSARENDVPALTTFVGEGLDLTGVVKMDTSWVDDTAGTAGDPYLIKDIQDLYGFAALVNGGDSFKDKTLKLVNDIDLNEGWTASATAPENVWEPIGSCTSAKNKTGNYFAGTFDGNDKTIKGLYVNTTSSSAGLFGMTVDSTIRNLGIENSYMTTSFADGMLGSFIGYGEGNLINVYSNATLVSDKIQVGGLIGRVQDKTGDGAATADITECNIINSQFSGVITSSNAGNAGIGGLVGAAIYGTTNIQNSIFDGQITAASTAERVGGLMGQDNGTNTTVTIENSVVAGSVSGASMMGAVIGRTGKQTTVESSVYVSGTYTIGMYGDVNKTDGSLIKAVSKNFADDAVLTATVTALNTNVVINNSSMANVTWKTWNKENGQPVFGEAPAGDIIDVAPDTTWLTKNAGTKADPYVIADAGDLYGLAQEVNGGNTFNGKFITLANDIKLNNGSAADWATTAPANIWEPIGKDTAKFQGTFDGKGNTISGLYLDWTSGFTGLFGYGGENSTIKNVRLENGYFETTKGDGGSIVGRTDGNLDGLFSSATFIGGNQNTGGIVGRFTGTNKSITNCWFAGNVSSSAIYVGGIVGRVAEGTTTVANCLNTGSVTSTIASSNLAWAGGIAGAIYKNGTATSITCNMYNCVNTGQVNVTNAAIIHAIGSVVGRTRHTTTFENIYTTTDPVNTGGGTINTKNGAEGIGSHSVNGNSVTGEATKVNFATAGVLADTLLALNTKANANTGWDNWVPRDGKPVLEQFAPALATIDVTPDTSWLNEGAGTEAEPYILIDAADLYGFAQASTSNKFSGKTIKLGANITVNNGKAADWATTAPANASWTPIGTNGYKFSGIFDGNGCSISGIYLKTTAGGGGLFGYTQSNSATDRSMVKNLRLLNSYFEFNGTGNAQLGSIAGIGPGDFSNLYSDAIMVSTGNYVGGIIGNVNRKATSTHNIDNCWFNGSIAMKGDAIYAGGIVGVATQGTIDVSNCLNTGAISSERTAGVNVGGVVGVPNNAAVLNMTNCVNAGVLTVNVDVCVGAILARNGVHKTSDATVTIRNSYMTGDSYTKFDVGNNGTGVFGTEHETSTYEADAAVLVQKLNNNETLWVAKKVNGKTIPVLISLQDVID